MNEVSQTATAQHEVDEVVASAGQQDLWLAEQLAKGSAQLYSIPVCYELSGDIDQALLQQAIELTLAGREAFRTCFIETDQGLFQHIYPKVEPNITWLDLQPECQELNPQAALELALAHCQQSFETHFDLGKPGLIRFLLIKLAGQRTLLHFNLHHLIGDNDSIGIILDDLAYYYQALLNGHIEVPPRVKEALEYGDFADWQHQMLDEGHFEVDKQFWLDQLTGVDGKLALHIGEPSVTNDESGDVLKHRIEGLLVEQINQFAVAQGISLAVAYFTAFAALLHRITDRQTIVFGVPSSLRGDEQLDNTVGYFINVLPVKVQFDSDSRFADIVRQLSEQLYATMEHKQYP